MTDFNITELRKLAENATPGPWKLSKINNDTGVSSSDGRLFVEVYHGFEGGPAGDLEHIAAFNPATVLALLDRLERAEAAIERVRAIHEREVIATHEGYGEEAWCPGCKFHWPCPTIAALVAAGAAHLGTITGGKEKNE